MLMRKNLYDQDRERERYDGKKISYYISLQEPHESFYFLFPSRAKVNTFNVHRSSLSVLRVSPVHRIVVLRSGQLLRELYW